MYPGVFSAQIKKTLQESRVSRCYSPYKFLGFFEIKKSYLYTNKKVTAMLISVHSWAGCELTWLNLYLPGKPNMYAGSICVLCVWVQPAVFALAKRELGFGTQMGAEGTGK